MPPNTWRPMLRTPTIRKTGAPSTSIEYLWPGGVLTRERTAIETVYRLQSGARKVYSLTGGWHPWSWVWTFRRMPPYYVRRLFTYWEWNRGTETTAPATLTLVPQINEWYGLPPWPPNDLPVEVDIEDTRLAFTREMGPLGKILGYSGSIRFLEVKPASSYLSTMEGGEPPTDDPLLGLP